MLQPKWGAHLQPLRELKTWPDIEVATEYALYRALDFGDVVGFAGAGMSWDHGYELWLGLAKKIVTKVSKYEEFHPPLSTAEGEYLRYVNPEYNPSLWQHPSTSKLTGILDYCHRLFFRRRMEDEFSKILEDNIRREPPKVPTGSPGRTVIGTPIEAVIEKLGIRRFVTTNYDRVIRDVLGSELNRERLAPIVHRPTTPGSADLGAESFCPTLSRIDAEISDLILFAIGTGEYQAGILYLHGRLGDQDQKVGAGVVLTETQYQRQYTSDGIRTQAIREADRLLFTANSILFVGCGLEDDDVLRPFRQFVSDNDIASQHRPWFALLPIEKKKKNAGECYEIFNRFYYRYGIRPIFFEVDEVEADFGGKLKKKIDEIRVGWLEYRKTRDQLPLARLPKFSRLPPRGSQRAEHDENDLGQLHEVMVHHATEYSKHAGRMHTQINVAEEGTFRECFGRQSGNSTHFVLGGAGRGKGSSGYWATWYRPDPTLVTISFFATFHFTNDFHSIIVGATGHLSEQGSRRGLLERSANEDGQSVVGQFFSVLEAIRANCVVVFGGVERLLRAIPYVLDQPVQSSNGGRDLAPSAGNQRRLDQLLKEMRLGRPANPEVAEFLKATLEFNRSQSSLENEKRLLLTTSIVPELLLAHVAGRGAGDGSRLVVPAPLVRADKARMGVAAPPSPDHAERPVTAPAAPQITEPPAAASHQFGSIFLSSDRDDDKYRGTDEVGRIAHEHLFLGDVLTTLKGHAKNNEVWDRWKENLELELGPINPEERAERIICAVVKFLSLNGLPGIGDCSKLALIMETLSLFTTPVPLDVLAVALYAQEAAKPGDGKGRKTAKQWKKEWKETLDRFVPELREATRLILEIQQVGGRLDARYTAHSIVRRAMLRGLGGRLERPAEIHQFDLNDFASEPADVQPLTAEGAEKTLQVFDALAEAYELPESHELPGSHELPAFYRRLAPAEAERKLKLIKKRDYIRAAYGVLRAGWSATGLGRLLTESISVGSPAPVYQQYNRRLTRLLNLAHAHSVELLGSGAERGAPPHEEAALYQDELAWLFNELGLVCYCQGELLDSTTYFRLGAQINETIEGGKPGYRMIQSNINLASVLIDRARLSQARELLIQAAAYTKALPRDGAETLARIHGFLGLVAHLAGDRRSAESLYTTAIEELSKLEAWRGVSMFRRHRADLLRMLRRLDHARKDIVEAIAVAEAGFHPDLVHFGRISEANLRRIEAEANPSWRVSITELEPTLRFARSIGSAKLESDVYRVRGLIELDQGNHESATRSALECLRLSRSHHLQLRMNSSLEMLGKIMQKREHVEDACRLFEACTRLAQRHGHQATMDAADRALALMERRPRVDRGVPR
jgi:hypothetical protein